MLWSIYNLCCRMCVNCGEIVGAPLMCVWCVVCVCVCVVCVWEPVHDHCHHMQPEYGVFGWTYCIIHSGSVEHM